MKKILLVIVFVSLIFSSCTGSPQNSYEEEVIKDESTQGPAVFLDSIPTEDFYNLTIEDFPSTKPYYSIPDGYIWNDNLYYLSYPYIFKYDLEGNLLAYTDPEIIKDAKELILIDNYLFIGSQDLGIYEVDLNNNVVSNFYDSENGLKSLQNFHFASDNNILWTGTFEGVAKINIQNEKIKFYDSELGIEGSFPSYYNSMVYARNSDIWAVVKANARSKGGTSNYDKVNDSWVAYGPEDFKTEDTGRIDFDKFVVSDEGVFAAFQDGGPEKLVLKKFNPVSNQWEEVYSAPYSEFNNNVDEYLPPPETYVSSQMQRDVGGFIKRFRVYHNNKWIEVPIVEKNFSAMVLGPDDQYYLLTNNGLETFSKDDDFPKQLISSDSVNDFGQSKLILTDDNKYIVFFSILINDMLGKWMNFGIGVYDIANDSFFDSVIEMEDLSESSVEKISQLTINDLKFDYDSEMVNISTGDAGEFIIDISSKDFYFVES
ncbi:hypothetical protein GF366_03545 [Candidatus Peregrinibacteria bacterium]|nr:hypothetical protein [Candidatus Peregrinibacteria bacterium]